MAVNGAGGSEGGIGRFFIGLIMLIAGGYLFLQNITVSNNLSFGFGSRLFGIGGVSITSGYVFIPFIFGIGMIFYNSKNFIGWLLALASIVMFGFGVIVNTNLRLRTMSAFELITILVLMIGGLGLFLSSLRNLPKE